MSDFETKTSSIVHSIEHLQITMVTIGHECRNLWIHPNLEQGYAMTGRGFKAMKGTDRKDLINRFVKDEDKEKLKKVLKMIGYE
tara:strand:- start:892 stop:1143 length:252 start_codon:yes stop_codon:yes gene_type:complete